MTNLKWQAMKKTELRGAVDGTGTFGKTGWDGRRRRRRKGGGKLWFGQAKHHFTLLRLWVEEDENRQVFTQT